MHKHSNDLWGTMSSLRIANNLHSAKYQIIEMKYVLIFMFCYHFSDEFAYLLDNVFINIYEVTSWKDMSRAFFLNEDVKQ